MSWGEGCFMACFLLLKVKLNAYFIPLFSLECRFGSYRPSLHKFFSPSFIFPSHVIQHWAFPLCLQYGHLLLTNVASCFGHCPAIFSHHQIILFGNDPTLPSFTCSPAILLVIQGEPSSVPVTQVKPLRGRPSRGCLSSPL